MAALIAPKSHVQLALDLPPMLLSFFRKHPPGTFSTSAISQPPPPPSIAAPSSSPSPLTSSLTKPPASDSAMTAFAEHKASSNPFLPYLNPLTNAWRPPSYSLRRQAEIYSLARQHGVLSLLPEAAKHPELKAAKREEQGLRIKGTGVGQKVKGKHWERQLAGKLEMRRKAMEGMPKMIREWKQRGHGRGWKKWPR